MAPIKVLHVVNLDKENYYHNNLVDFSDATGVEYSFITLSPYCDFAQELEKRGKRVYCLDALSRKDFPSAAFAMRKILVQEKTDIVHTHEFDPSLIGLSVAKLLKRKTVVTRHHSDAIHEIKHPVRKKFYLTLENYINRKSDHIIAPSQMVRYFLVEKEGVPDEKVTIIPYGQTTERFDAVTPQAIAKVRAELGMQNDLAIVNVSRLFHRKGHEYLFEAFSELLKDGLAATLYLVGEGDYRSELEKIAARLGIIERVRFLGWRDDALAIVAASDIVVHPSLEDALSSAVIETVILGKPIIATDISGVRDSLDNGRGGKIVAPADAKEIRAALRETIDNFEEARAKAVEGRKYLLEYMDARRVANEYLRIYRKIIR